MSIREQVPGDRGGTATQDVAAVLAAVTVPSIEPFGTDTPVLVGLPLYIPIPVPDPEPASVVGIAREVYDQGLHALGVLKKLEDALSACKASLVARVVGAAGVEAGVIGLDSWQRGVMESSALTHLGLVLGIPERTAAVLAHHSTELVDSHPRVLAGLSNGLFSFRHATVMMDEFGTLNEHGDISDEKLLLFEDRLLKLVLNTTVACFQAKARRARESMFPATMATRTKEAFRQRTMTCLPGKDGMSWLTLYVPTLAAEGIYTNCTRLARALKADANTAQSHADQAGTGQDCREYRTLTQLRADVGATLLLGPPPTNTNSNTGARAGARAGAGAGAGGSAGGGEGSVGGDGLHDRVNTSDGNNAWFGGVRIAEEEAPWHYTGPRTSPNPSSNTSPNPGSSTGPHTAAAPELNPKLNPELNPEVAPGWTAVDGESFAHTTANNPTSQPFSGTVLPETSGSVVGDEVLVGELVGDGSGFIDGVVDGIFEDPQGEYLRQLEAVAHSKVITDPPLPKALILLKVPVLGLLGITDEPAELAGPLAGPVPENIARLLLAQSTTFLRVLTDPITGEALPAQPQRYTLKEAEKLVLQALAGHCYVANCPNPVIDTDLDHLEAFEFGGQSSMMNLRPACKRHHTMKHFKDDKNRDGQRRCINEPERNNIRLRGWTPQPTSDGRIGWITPSGTYQEPPEEDTPRPRYPKWLKKLITKQLKKRS